MLINRSEVESVCQREIKGTRGRGVNRTGEESVVGRRTIIKCIFK